MSDVPSPGHAGIILIVEDDKAMAHLFKEVLEATGYKVKLAMNGKKATHILNKFGNDIYVIVTDIMMPGITGYDLINYIASHHPYRVGIIIITALPSINSESLVSECYVDFCLYKPFGLQEVMSRIGESYLRIVSSRSTARE
jgi:DNA-binding response OmpR family regulator